MKVAPDKPGEIWEDKRGNRWMVIGLFKEPTVEMQRVEPRYREDDPSPERKFGGVHGLMWDGFKKVLDAPSPPKETE